jgi:hypothetical protein
MRDQVKSIRIYINKSRSAQRTTGTIVVEIGDSMRSDVNRGSGDVIRGDRQLKYRTNDREQSGLPDQW